MVKESVFYLAAPPASNVDAAAPVLTLIFHTEEAGQEREWTSPLDGHVRQVAQHSTYFLCLKLNHVATSGFKRALHRGQAKGSAPGMPPLLPPRAPLVASRCCGCEPVSQEAEAGQGDVLFVEHGDRSGLSLTSGTKFGGECQNTVFKKSSTSIKHF